MRVARNVYGARSARAAAAAFAAGVIAASVATLASVAFVGGVLLAHVSGLAVAAACVAAAALDLLGVRVRPQIPLQVPERWRRVLPLPVALCLYGLLLGTGFSTAVPAYALWAMLLLVGALGHVGPALAAGAALGVGRALPVLLARGLDERGRMRRLVRAVGACTLLAAALAFPAAAHAGPFAASASDPSAAGGDVAWEEPAGGVLLRADGTRERLPGHEPAVGGSLVAWFDGATVTVADRATLVPRFDEQIVGIRQLALSDDWLALRQVQPDGTWRLIVQSLADTSVHRVIAEARPPAAIGRPAVDGSTVVFARSSTRGSSIVSVDLSTGRERVVRSSATSLLSNPGLSGGTLLYVQTARCAQWVRVGTLNGSGGRVVETLPALAGQDLGHERGHTDQGSRTPCSGRLRPTTSILWTTAIDDRFAYVTILGEPRAAAVTSRIVRVAR